MPEFIAVQCFKCNQFQVSQKRKDSKFNCKLCNAKQSVRKIIAHSGRAADVRKFIQQLNLARGRAEEQFDEREPDAFTNDICHQRNANELSSPPPDAEHEQVPLAQSRWQPYSIAVTKKSTSLSDEGEKLSADDDIVTSLPDMQRKGRGRKRKRSSRQRQQQQQQQRRENIERGYERAAVRTQKCTPEKDERLGNAAWNRYHLGAIPFREQSSENDPPSGSLRQEPCTRHYQWGSGMPQTKQSSPPAPVHPSNHRSRWGVPPPDERPAPHRYLPPPSVPARTALGADGLLTTLGADEVVEEEVLY